MKITRGLHHLMHSQPTGAACALTIGNFDGLHRGHQAMLALLVKQARQRGIDSCVMTFEPHPRDYFAALHRTPQTAPARIATLRDKLTEIKRCGIDHCVILPFNPCIASQAPNAFIEHMLVRALGVKYVLIGDDFRFGAHRAGDYALLEAAGQQFGFDVGRMPAHQMQGLRVSSSAVRQALHAGQMDRAAALLGRPYSISGHVVHGGKLGRSLGASEPGKNDGFRTLNLRFPHPKPAASGVFAVRVHGLGPCDHPPLAGVANLGVRPSLSPHDRNAGCVLLETHCLDWPSSLPLEGAYGKIIRVELLHKLHDEINYHSLQALSLGIANDCDRARAFFACQPCDKS